MKNLCCNPFPLPKTPFSCQWSHFRQESVENEKDSTCKKYLKFNRKYSNYLIFLLFIHRLLSATPYTSPRHQAPSIKFTFLQIHLVSIGVFFLEEKSTGKMRLLDKQEYHRDLFDKLHKIGIRTFSLSFPRTSPEF